MVGRTLRDCSLKAASQSNWQELLQIARSLIDQVNSKSVIINEWTLGGGTAMMLQIQHRVSFDIDIFLPDPQLLGFLDPEVNTFRFDPPPVAFLGDGARFQRYVFENLGEIDFIAGPPLTKTSSADAVLAGQPLKLETIPEIIAKKIHYRGKSIQTRDLFDIAAAAKTHSKEVREALKVIPQDVRSVLAAIAVMDPGFVKGAVQELRVMPAFLSVAEDALEVSTEFLRTALNDV